jgi:isopropylmalate/homocitrate/citramalate synthase
VNDTSVTICEVGPRDGLQAAKVVVHPERRAELANRVAGTGVPRVEAASFVSPTRVPQMADAELVVRHLDRDTGASFASLVLNGRGLERALSCGVEEVHVVYPLTDTFAQRNQGTDVEEAANTAAQMLRDCAAADVRATATLGVAFGCPFEGAVAPGHVADHAARMVDAGAEEIVLADTVGVAFPGEVRALVRRVRLEVPHATIAIHLHNTRNTGYANAVVALEEGVRSFDASIGGLGGCPFAPKASGNVATEDLVHLLEGEGADTGVDLDALIRITEWLDELVPDRLPGLVRVAGPAPASAPLDDQR